MSGRFDYLRTDTSEPAAPGRFDYLRQGGGRFDYLRTPEPEEEGFLEEMLRRMGQSGLGIVHAAGRVGEGLQKALTPDFLEVANPEAERLLHEELPSLIGRVAPADQRPFLERARDTGFLRAGAGAVASAIPGLAAGLVSGGAGSALGLGFGAGMGIGSGTVGAVSSGVGAFDSVKEAGADDSTALSVGTGVGLLSMILDAYGAFGLAKPLRTAATKELAEKISKGGTDRLLRDILVGGGKEVSTEFAQEIIFAGGELVGGRPIGEVLSELDDRLAEATIGAAGLSLGAGGATAGLARRRGRQRLAHQQRTGLRTEGIKDFLERLDQVPEETRRAFLAGELQSLLDWKPESQPAHHTTEELQNLVVAPEAAPISQATLRYAQVISPEIATLAAVKKVLGPEVALEMEDGFSHTRVGVARQVALLESPVMDLEGNMTVPALTDILAESKGKGFEVDPNPTWLHRWIDPDQVADLEKVWKVDPGLRYVEEVRWIEHQKELAAREAEQIARDEADRATRKAVEVAPGVESEPVTPARRIFTDPKAVAAVEAREVELRRSPHYETWRRTARMLSLWQATEVTLANAAGWISADKTADILQFADTYAAISEIPAERAPVESSESSIDVDSLFPAVKHGLPGEGHQNLWSPTVAGIRRMQQMLPAAYRQINTNNFYRLLKGSEDARARFAELGIYLGELPAELPPVTGASKGDGAYVELKAYEDGVGHSMWMPRIYAESLGHSSPVVAALQSSMALKVAGMLTSVKRTTAIFTPRFALTTAVRDQFEAALISRHGYRAFADMARGAFHLFTHSPEAEEGKAQGIGMGSIVSSEINRARGQYGEVAISMTAKDANSMLAAIGWKMRKIGRAWKTEIKETDLEHQPAALLYPLARMTEGIDKASRLGAYLRARDAGVAPAESLAEQRRTNIDFLRKPTGIMSQASRLKAFFNPLAQSFDLNIRALFRDPIRAAKTVTGLLLVPELVHFLINADDEDYQNLEEWEKRRYHFWHKNADGTWFRTPRPLGIVAAAFGYGFGEALRASYRGDPRTMSRVLAALQDETPVLNFMPVIPGEQGVLKITPKEALAVTPEQLLPAVEQMANRKLFFDSPIVPEWMENRSPNERSFRSTPQLYKSIAKLLGPKAEPLQVEYWARTGGGAILSSAVRLGQAREKHAAGQDVPWNLLPGISAFVARRKDGPAQAPVQRLFELVDEGRWLASKTALRGASPVRRREILSYRRLKKELERIRDLIERSNIMNEQLHFDARNRLDAQIVKIAERALMAVGERGAPGEGPAGPFWQMVFGGEE